MSRPRQVLPGQFQLITRRCTQRQFLLRPDEETNQVFTYCLAEAAQRFEIEIVLAMAESNHHHTVIYDRHGRFPQFVEHFHKMVARCQNARWGRWENFWAAEEVCVTRLLTTDTVMDKLVYVATNPVKDLLVDKVSHWPGTNGYRHLLQRQPLRARRPRHFFRDGGTMPDEVTLHLTVPAELGEASEVIEELRRRVEIVELTTREERMRAGRFIVGRHRVSTVSPRSSPTTSEPRRNLRPRFAGPKPERIAALLAYKEFLATYDDARRTWVRGSHVRFPRGTYWLARFAPISVEPSFDS
jgi:REP element-mobilizing transposase RayT